MRRCFVATAVPELAAFGHVEEPRRQHEHPSHLCDRLALALAANTRGVTHRGEADHVRRVERSPIQPLAPTLHFVDETGLVSLTAPLGSFGHEEADGMRDAFVRLDVGGGDGRRRRSLRVMIGQPPDIDVIEASGRGERVSVLDLGQTPHAPDVGSQHPRRVAAPTSRARLDGVEAPRHGRRRRWSAEHRNRHRDHGAGDDEAHRLGPAMRANAASLVIQSPPRANAGRPRRCEVGVAVQGYMSIGHLSSKIRRQPRGLPSGPRMSKSTLAHSPPKAS